MKFTKLGAVALAAALSLAACGGSDDDSSSEGPIKVMVISADGTELMNAPQVWDVAKVSAELINDDGGINGRDVEVITCNDKNNPNDAQACARTAVDEDVVAVVGGTSFQGATIQPVLDAAGIPWIANNATGPEDQASPNSFVLTAAGGASYAGSGVALGQLCESPKALVVDIPAGVSATETFVQMGYEAAGGTGKLPLIKVSPGGSDMTAPVAQAMDGSDCILLLVPDQQGAQALQTLERAGADQRIIAQNGTIPLDIMVQFPALYEDTVQTASFPSPTSEAMAEYAQVVEDNGIENAFTNQPQGTWLGFKVLKEVASQIDGDITAESLMKQLNSTTTLDTGGITPTLDLTQGLKVDGMERVFNPSVVYYTMRDGELVELWPDFFDLTPVFEGGAAPTLG